MDAGPGGSGTRHLHAATHAKGEVSGPGTRKAAAARPTDGRPTRPPTPCTLSHQLADRPAIPSANIPPSLPSLLQPVGEEKGGAASIRGRAAQQGGRQRLHTGRRQGAVRLQPPRRRVGGGGQPGGEPRHAAIHRRPGRARDGRGAGAAVPAEHGQARAILPCPGKRVGCGKERGGEKKGRVGDRACTTGWDGGAL